MFGSPYSEVYMTVFDEIHDRILLMINEGNPSIREIATEIDRSLATTHERLKSLEQEGLIYAPREQRTARDRKITDLGGEYLIVNGLIHKDLSHAARRPNDPFAS